MKNVHNVVSDALENVRGGRGATQRVDNPGGDEIEYVVEIIQDEKYMKLEVFLDHGGCTALVLERRGWSARFMNEFVDYLVNELYG